MSAAARELRLLAAQTWCEADQQDNPDAARRLAAHLHYRALMLEAAMAEFERVCAQVGRPRDVGDLTEKAYRSMLREADRG